MRVGEYLKIFKKCVEDVRDDCVDGLGVVC